MFFRKIIFFLPFFFSLISSAQKETDLSPLSKVSVLTIGTQEELSSRFGHSAFRIQDPALGIDVTYNYGMFDFDAPNFYLKFTTGKLPYSIARHSFNNFIHTYKVENRWVKEQTLNLNRKERNDLLQFLEHNILPENKFYKYDFLFDNCATKIPEVLNKVTGKNLVPSFTHLDNKATFRDLIHESLDANAWATFGIDLALGSVIDRKASSEEYQFLPIYVYHQLENTSKGDNTPLVAKTEMILKTKAKDKNSYFLLSPIFWFALLLAIVVLITIKDYSSKKRTKWIDTFLFATTGIAGIVLLLLWVATDHNATAWNYNLLWAFPGNIYVAYVLQRKRLPIWIKIYFITLLSILLISLFIWAAKIQIFSIIIIFILLSLAIRYLYLLFHLRRRND